MRSHLFSISLILALPVHAADGLPLTPPAISDLVARDGAGPTVQRLVTNKRSPQWDAVLRQVETGDDRWLAVARELSAGTDAGTSEGLQVALATALPKNPAGVLRLAGTQPFLSLTNLCSAPFIEPQPAFFRRYLSSTRKALLRLKDAAIESRRLECLAEIDKAMTEQSSTR